VAEARRGTENTAGARAIAEGALFADLTVIIILLGLYVPYAGPVLATISPLPLLLLVLRQGWRISLQASAVAVLLVGFLTGPLSAIAVGVIAVRATSLGIGMRRNWRPAGTIFVGTLFFWACFYTATLGVALLIPSWRAATEEGFKLTYNQGSAVLGGLLGLVGFGATWQHTWHPELSRWFDFFIDHWMLLLPAVAFPVLVIGVMAEYVIAEAILPPFGFKPRPLRLPFTGGASTHTMTNEAPKQKNEGGVIAQRLSERRERNADNDDPAKSIGTGRQAQVPVEERVER
jgi:hypothetical protein